MGKKLYVGNLPYSVDDGQLESQFSECGKVESARVITDRDTGRSKGFGFVEMSTDEEAAAAIEKFNGQPNGGRNMTVSEARPQAPVKAAAVAVVVVSVVADAAAVAADVASVVVEAAVAVAAAAEIATN